MLAVPAVCSAAPISLIAGDGFGTSSFNAAGQWDSVAAPTAGNDYFNATFLLRTPPDGGDYTFAGDSLTITGAGLAAGANNEALMWKGSGTTSIITVANLTIDGGQLRHGQGSGDTFTLAGDLTVGANGANIATQGGMIINANLIGSDTIRILDAGNTEAARLITIGSGLNTFTGDIELFGSAADRSRILLADNANLNFVIGASGVNNSVFGTGTATFDGDFAFDLSGAGMTIGDSWSIASADSQSFGATFSVAGFTDLGNDTWSFDNGGPSYLFDESSATLSVIPEPGTLALVMLGFAGLVARARQRRA